MADWQDAANIQSHSLTAKLIIPENGVDLANSLKQTGKWITNRGLQLATTDAITMIQPSLSVAVRVCLNQPCDGFYRQTLLLLVSSMMQTFTVAVKFNIEVGRKASWRGAVRFGLHTTA